MWHMIYSEINCQVCGAKNVLSPIQSERMDQQCVSCNIPFSGILGEIQPHHVPKHCKPDKMDIFTAMKDIAENIHKEKARIVSDLLSRVLHRPALPEDIARVNFIINIATLLEEDLFFDDLPLGKIEVLVSLNGAEVKFTPSKG